jgi:hypothetical protein
MVNDNHDVHHKDSNQQNPDHGNILMQDKDHQADGRKDVFHVKEEIRTFTEEIPHDGVDLDCVV